MVYGVITVRFNAYELDEGDAWLVSNAQIHGVQYPDLFWNVMFTKGTRDKQVTKGTMNRSFDTKFETKYPPNVPISNERAESRLRYRR